MWLEGEVAAVALRREKGAFTNLDMFHEQSRAQTPGRKIKDIFPFQTAVH